MSEQDERASRQVPQADMLSEHPCWCGRPAVEVVSAWKGGGEVETKGYCERHCQLSTTLVTRFRVDAPR